MSLVPFDISEDADPSLPGDPFVYTRWQDGRLVSALDLLQDRRQVALQQRLRAALLGGAGTIRGLRVGYTSDPSDGNKLSVAPGIAQDAAGRLISVLDEQCLHITDLHEDPIWSALESLPSPTTAAGADTRRAHVILRYEACPTDPVPTLGAPCGTCDRPGGDVTYGRISERFRIDLSQHRPPEPDAQLLQWLSAAQTTPVALPPVGTSRDELERWVLDDVKNLAALWTGPLDAPLLLATLVLVKDGDKVRVEGDVDNTRALMIPDWLVVDHVLPFSATERLVAREFKVRFDPPTVASGGNSEMVVEIALSAEPDEASVLGGSVSVRTLDPASGWTPSTAAVVTRDSTVIRIGMPGPEWPSGTTYQIHLVGEGPNPIVDDLTKTPLAGWWDERPLPGDGRGRDVSFVGTYTTP